MDIAAKYNHDKESIIQYSISELLNSELSVNLKNNLESFKSKEIEYFLSLFPIQSKGQISEIKKMLNKIKEMLPKNLFEEANEEVNEICADYKWKHSKEGNKILQIEQWIEKVRDYLSTNYPNELIYVGRSFIDPISLIVGGFVKDRIVLDSLIKILENMSPPINIEYRISIQP